MKLLPWKSVDTGGWSTEAIERSRGLSLLEVIVGSAIMVGVLLALTQNIISSGESAKSATTVVNLAETFRAISRRLGDELRTAIRKGEDANGNDILDTGEDLNGNGHLDADWSVGAHSITFNRLLADGTISTGITYRLVGTNLERLSSVTSDRAPIRAVIASGVSTFDVTQTDSMLQFDVELSKTHADGTVYRQQYEFSVVPRN